MDERPLNSEIIKFLAKYADSTGKFFCRRCGICETENSDKIPIFNIMEMLMYSRGYGGKDTVSKMFAQIPIEIRSMINSSNYSNAERKCPQKMPIAQLMKEAFLELS